MNIDFDYFTNLILPCLFLGLAAFGIFGNLIIIILLLIQKLKKAVDVLVLNLGFGWNDSKLLTIENFGDHFRIYRSDSNLSLRSLTCHQYFLSSTNCLLDFREALEAFADLVYSLGLPMLATELFLQRHWIFGSVPCKLVSTVLLLNLYGSVYFLSTISLGELLIEIKNDFRNLSKSFEIGFKRLLWSLRSMLCSYGTNKREKDTNKHVWMGHIFHILAICPGVFCAR